MKIRSESFREQFRKKDLSKLEFRKIRGYHFMKVDKETPNHGWILTKDDTSAVIKLLAYTDGEQVVKYPNCKDLRNLLDLEQASAEVKSMWDDESNREYVSYSRAKQAKERKTNLNH